MQRAEPQAELQEVLRVELQEVLRVEPLEAPQVALPALQEVE